MRLRTAPLLFTLVLSACVQATPPAPPPTVQLPNGKQGLQIPISFQAPDDLKNLDAAEQAQLNATIEGPGRGFLADRAKAACPGGYRIVDRSPLTSKFVMVLANGLPNYRATQTITIACT